MRSRPAGITVASILAFVSAVQYAVLAMLMAANPSAVVAYLHRLSPGGSGPEKIHLAMGRFEIVYYAVMTMLTLALGRGLWKLENWTRLILLGMISVSALTLITGIVHLPATADNEAWVLWGLRAALCAVGIWYLMRPNVRRAFGRKIAERPAKSSDGISVRVVACASLLAAVIGTALFGFLAAVVVIPSEAVVLSAAIAALLKQALLVVACGAVVGVIGWGIAFTLKRDGWHRMEDVAFQRINYGGRNPFDTSDWNAAK